MIEIDVRTAEASAFIRSVWSDQLPFVTSKAINRTATDFQAAQRAHQATIFEIRRPAFVQNAVKIKPFATKVSLEARVSIDPPGGQRRADVLTKFEDETEKLPFGGGRIAVPRENVPRTGAGIIQKQWRPKNLGFEAHGRGKVFSGKTNVLTGKRRTVLMKRLRGGARGAIFQRDGDELVPLYWLVPRVRIKPDLHFVMNAERTVTDRWASNFDSAFAQAMRTARVS